MVEHAKALMEEFEAQLRAQRMTEREGMRLRGEEAGVGGHDPSPSGTTCQTEIATSTLELIKGSCSVKWGLIRMHVIASNCQVNMLCSS